MATKKSATSVTKKSAVEIITDKKPAGDPVVSIKTGKTNQKTFYFKINQPKGRALLIAVHL